MNGGAHVGVRDDAKLNMMREVEIMSKAVSAIFLLLLKWFRVSRELSPYRLALDTLLC